MPYNTICPGCGGVADLIDIEMIQCVADANLPAPSGIIVGEIRAFVGVAAPAGWLLCDGEGYDASHPQYDELSALLYAGAINGFFYVPDLRGRGLVGAGVNPVTGTAFAHLSYNGLNSAHAD